MTDEINTQEIRAELTALQRIAEALEHIARVGLITEKRIAEMRKESEDAQKIREIRQGLVRGWVKKEGQEGAYKWIWEMNEEEKKQWIPQAL